MPAVTRRVTMIPASLSRYAEAKPVTAKRRKVAGYARVSTDHEDQQTSYAAQIDYYTNYIKSKDEWEFVEVYTDEGISATTTRKREGFNRMVQDALDGKIDLIITKSVSRFARNTVDSLTTIRKLKDAGVECHFEKENIWTFDSKGELLITIMSSLAQEESRSISENCKWGQRKRFADGKVSIPFPRFLGYDQGPNGEFVINEEQAEIVRFIFAEFNKHRSYGYVSDLLESKGMRTPSGEGHWAASTVKSIILNEKYRGDALLQKSYIGDFLTKKQIKNHGEVQQYYVANNHEAIIDPETFEFSQYLAKEISKDKGRFVSRYTMTGRIRCAQCGRWYGRRTWHSTDKHKCNVWQCPNRQRRREGRERCKPPHIYESQVKEMFITALNQLVEMKEEIIKVTVETMDEVFDLTTLQKEESELAIQIENAGKLLEEHVMINASRIQNQKEYEQKYQKLAGEYQSLLDRMDLVTEQIQDKKARKIFVNSFLDSLRNQDLIEEYTDDLFLTFVDYLEIDHDGHARFVFMDGTETSVDIPPKRKERWEPV